MQASLPLISHTWQEPIAYRDGVVITAAQYLADVQYCASILPTCKYALLDCLDRYAFAVGFGAALVCHQSCLLPSTHTEELIATLAKTHENLYSLTDRLDSSIKLPQTYIGDNLLKAKPALQTIPMIAAQAIAAYVFTSGSTGLPVAYAKSWERLVINVKSEGRRLGIVPGSHHTIVSTVPPQHMYGFESTILIALQNSAAFYSAKPFYPADIDAALNRTNRPRALVTTPFHLRAFISEVQTPAVVDLLVCATAPLAVALAVQAEDKVKAPLLEIYGSTETGQLATRRTTESVEWITFEGIQIHKEANKSFASGKQIEGVVEINDVLELKDAQKFILHGRTADMVNVAGKSTTLGYLNHQLLSIPGVVDGSFFVTDDESEGLGSTARLAAVAVAPGLSLEIVQTELRRKIAPAFLPRPLKLLSTLPRNATGKLPREALLKLIRPTSDGLHHANGDADAKHSNS